MNKRQKRVQKDMIKLETAIVVYGYKLVDHEKHINTKYYERNGIIISCSKKKIAIYTKHMRLRKQTLPLSIAEAMEVIASYEDYFQV